MPQRLQSLSSDPLPQFAGTATRPGALRPAITAYVRADIGRMLGRPDWQRGASSGALSVDRPQQSMCECDGSLPVHEDVDVAVVLMAEGDGGTIGELADVPIGAVVCRRIREGSRFVWRLVGVRHLNRSPVLGVQRKRGRPRRAGGGPLGIAPQNHSLSTSQAARERPLRDVTLSRSFISTDIERSVGVSDDDGAQRTVLGLSCLRRRETRASHLPMADSQTDVPPPMAAWWHGWNIAEFEVDLIRMRTREGMAVTRAQGRLKGRKPMLTPKQQRELKRMHETGEYTISDLSELFSVSRPTVYRTLNRMSS